MPELTLSLPAALGLLALFVTIGAVLVFFVVKGTNGKAPVDPTATATITPTVTTTVTPTITITPTLEMTATPLPPHEYTIQAGDTCSSIAGFYTVSINSIILANSSKINSQCSNLVPGTTIQVPQPTPFPSPQPSSTLNPSQATVKACDTVDYTVKDADSLSTIAANYAVPISAIKAFNGRVNDQVFSGETLKIPLCQRELPNAPTPTPTLPPPYSAPQLLLPADGAPFSLANETVTLQWSSVGTLRNNEAYAVTIEDITDGSGRKLVEYVTEQKFMVPASFRPGNSLPHVMRWTVLPVRQSGTTKENEPIWEPAGAVSQQRVFTWSGAASPEPSPTP